TEPSPQHSTLNAQHSLPRVLALTATATPAIQAEIARHFGLPFTTVNLGTFRPNLALEAVGCRNREEKWERLRSLCIEQPGPAIIYVDQRRLAETLAARLRAHGFSAVHYHAGMEREERAAAQNRFMRGEARIAVATIAFGM